MMCGNTGVGGWITLCWSIATGYEKEGGGRGDGGKEQ